VCIPQNRLLALPPDIGRLTCLRVLEARKNGLTALPRSVQSLAALSQLDVRENDLRDTPLLPAGTTLEQLFLGTFYLLAVVCLACGSLLA
jgi:Leucine-rich repeat (LRR) protein